MTLIVDSVVVFISLGVLCGMFKNAKDYEDNKNDRR